MKGLIAGSVLLGVLAAFLLVVPAIQIHRDETVRTKREQAIFISNIAAALSRSTLYRVMVAEFHAQHGYFPSHIDEIDPRPDLAGSALADPARPADIEIANFGDVVLHIRDANDAPAGTITLTAVDDEHTASVDWECHTADFANIREHFPQCRYTGTAR